MRITLLLLTLSFVCNSQTWLNVPYVAQPFEVTDTTTTDAPYDYNWAGGVYDRSPTTRKIFRLYSIAGGHDQSQCWKTLLETSDNYDSPLSEPEIVDESALWTYINVLGSYLKSGRLVIAYCKTVCGDGFTQTVHTKYTDNDGLTWSTPYQIDTNKFTYGSVGSIYHQSMLEMPNGDVCWIGIWRTKDYKYGTTVLLRSLDSGETFDSINIINVDDRDAGDGLFVEPNGVHFNDSVIVVIGRSFDKVGYRQWTSSDYGVTWRDDGLNALGETLGGGDHSPVLKKFNVGNKLIIANYLYNRTEDTYSVLYADADTLWKYGLSGWDLGTKSILPIDVGDGTDGYPNIFHVGNTPEAYGVIVDDQALTKADVIYYKMKSNHIDTIMRVLYE